MLPICPQPALTTPQMPTPTATRIPQMQRSTFGWTSVQIPSLTLRARSGSCRGLLRESTAPPCRKPARLSLNFCSWQGTRSPCGTPQTSRQIWSTDTYKWHRHEGDWVSGPHTAVWLVLPSVIDTGVQASRGWSSDGRISISSWFAWFILLVPHLSPVKSIHPWNLISI